MFKTVRLSEAHLKVYSRWLTRGISILVLMLPVSFISSLHLACADDSQQALSAAAGRRLADLKLAENKLLTDIDICHRQIDSYQKILDSRQTDLQEVRDNIRSIEVAFRWL